MKDAVRKKPAFFFSDNLETDEAQMSEGVSRWVRKIDGEHYVIPSRSKRHSITHLHYLSLPRRNEWSLTMEAPRAVNRDLMHGNAIPRSERGLVSLQFGSLRADLARADLAIQASLFANLFMGKREVNYPKKPCLPG